ncbi:hypothetical protein [Tellurirhabdus bombi]|uniref:hypothetical protein n=1 Tax=Tellurirhabdus bombi TaxID=2907205 RepID=UPI001F1751A3|nr:hypothetical protein [Tellurirhabdus bombi]
MLPNPLKVQLTDVIRTVKEAVNHNADLQIVNIDANKLLNSGTLSFVTEGGDLLEVDLKPFFVTRNEAADLLGDSGTPASEDNPGLLRIVDLPTAIEGLDDTKALTAAKGKALLEVLLDLLLEAALQGKTNLNATLQGGRESSLTPVVGGMQIKAAGQKRFDVIDENGVYLASFIYTVGPDGGWAMVNERTGVVVRLENDGQLHMNRELSLTNQPQVPEIAMGMGVEFVGGRARTRLIPLDKLADQMYNQIKQRLINENLIEGTPGAINPSPVINTGVVLQPIIFVIGNNPYVHKIPKGCIIDTDALVFAVTQLPGGINVQSEDEQYININVAPTSPYSGNGLVKATDTIGQTNQVQFEIRVTAPGGPVNDLTIREIVRVTGPNIPAHIYRYLVHLDSNTPDIRPFTLNVYQGDGINGQRIAQKKGQEYRESPLEIDVPDTAAVITFEVISETNSIYRATTLGNQVVGGGGPTGGGTPEPEPQPYFKSVARSDAFQNGELVKIRIITSLQQGVDYSLDNGPWQAVPYFPNLQYYVIEPYFSASNSPRSLKLKNSTTGEELPLTLPAGTPTPDGQWHNFYPNSGGGSTGNYVGSFEVSSSSNHDNSFVNIQKANWNPETLIYTLQDIAPTPPLGPGLVYRYFPEGQAVVYANGDHNWVDDVSQLQYMSGTVVMLVKAVVNTNLQPWQWLSTDYAKQEVQLRFDLNAQPAQ